MPVLFRPFVPAVAFLLGTIGCGRHIESPPRSASASSRADEQTPNPTALSDSADIPVWAGTSTDEPFDVKHFLATRAAPVDNGASLYRSGLALISRDVGGERSAPLEERIRGLADLEKLVPETIPEVERILADAAQAIECIDASQAKPNCIFVTGLSADARLPHAQASRTFAKLSVLQLFAARTKGEFDSAEAAIRRCLRLSRDLRPRGHFVCQLVSIANDGTIFSAIERLTLRDPSLAAEKCDRLLALLVEHERHGIDRYQEGLRMDYILARSSIQDLQTGRLTLDQIFEFISGLDDDKRGSIGPIALNYEAEISACNQLFSILLKAAENSVPGPDEFSEFHREIAELKSGWESFKAKVAATEPSLRPKLRSQIPAMQFHTWTASVIAAHEASRRAMAGLAGLQMLIALRRYELAHQRLPTTLAEAAAETILRTVPTDPYSGKPLQFAVVAGKPTIYSVGNDFKDDGGQPDWSFGAQPGDYLFKLSPQGE